MARRTGELPERIPDGATYAVEGRAGDDGMFHVSARYLLLPDGVRLDLPTGPVPGIGCAAPRPRRRPARALETA